jgi:hypothetical protein
MEETSSQEVAQAPSTISKEKKRKKKKKMLSNHYNLLHLHHLM